MVPKKKLTIKQKDNQKNGCLDVLDRIKNNQDFFSRVITGDQSPILEYEPVTKCQSEESFTDKSVSAKPARMNELKIKSMLICFLAVGQVVHNELVLPGHTVHQMFYNAILVRLRKR